MQFLLNFILISSFFLIPNASLSSEKLRVQLKWKHQFQFAGYYAAIEKGFYKESNLDVELIEANEEKKDLEGVLSGEVDIGIAGSNLVLLKSRGLPVVVLGTIFQHSPLAFLVPGRSGIGNVHEIQNKRLMLEGHAEELLAYLKSEGIRIETMNTVPHEFDIKFLLDGSVDVISAYQTDEPFLLKENKIPYYLFTPRSVGIDFYGDTIYTTRDTLHEKKDAILLFLDATYKGWSYALKHKEEIVDLIYDKYSQRHSRAHLLFEAEETEKLILPDIVELGYFNPGRWEQIAEQYKKINMLEGEFTLNEFLLERNPEKDLIWIYYYLLIIGGGICIALYLAFRYLQFNKFITEQTEELKIKKNKLQPSEKILMNSRNLLKRKRESLLSLKEIFNSPKKKSRDLRESLMISTAKLLIEMTKSKDLKS